MGKEILPITDAKGKLIVHDKYVDGAWVGSRRTLEQAISDIGLDATIRPSQRGN